MKNPSTALLISELIGPQLDMAVAFALGYVEYNGPWWHHRDDPSRILHISEFSPSANSQQGHDIIEADWIGLDRPGRGQSTPTWRALADFTGDRKFNRYGSVVAMYGPTALIAAMRCKVASIYGEGAVPAELMDLLLSAA